LGNQLFQYATGRCLAVKKRIPHFLLNTDSYGYDAFGRKFGLDNFCIKGSVIKSAWTRNALRKGTKINKCLSVLPFYHAIEETGLRLHQFRDRLPLYTSLSGYWQSDSYFREIRDILTEELVPSELPPFPQWQGAPDTIAVHIRRTDYLADKRFGPLSENYYHDAMTAIRTSVKDPVFIFFSDDLEWCKERFPDKEIVFFEEKAWAKDYLQLFLMSKCKHQVIANSSFSWWAAWLNTNPDRIIIRPETPFLDGALLYESYYPADWTVIKN
jgi:hypothetical protein